MGKTCLQSKANLQSKVNHVLVGFFLWVGGELSFRVLKYFISINAP